MPNIWPIFLHEIMEHATLPYNGVGVFVRVYSWQADAANSVPITASRFDTEENGFATGLSNCITRDGQGVPIADIPWGTHGITALRDPTGNQEPVTLGFLNGTSGLNYLQSTQVRYIQTPAEIAAGVTPVNYFHPVGTIDRYGTNALPGITDMTAAFNVAMSIANVYAQMLPGGIYRVTSTLVLSGNKTLTGPIGGTQAYQISTIYHDSASAGVLFDLTTSENGGFALQYFNVTGGNGSFCIKTSRPYVDFKYIHMETYNGSGIQFLTSGFGVSSATVTACQWVGPASATSYVGYEINCNGGDVEFDRCVAIRGAVGFHILQGQTIILRRPSCNKQSIFNGFSSATQFNTSGILIDGAGYKQSITIDSPYIEACTNGIYSLKHECLNVLGGWIDDAGVSGAISGSYTQAGGSGNSLINVANAACRNTNLIGVRFNSLANGLVGTPYYLFYFGAGTNTRRMGCTVEFAGDWSADYNLASSTTTVIDGDTILVTTSNPSGNVDASGLMRSVVTGRTQGWIAPTFVNSWVTGASPCGYRIDAEGRVSLRGFATTGSAGTIMFTLPTGYRPTADQSFVVNASGALGIITVTASNGNVTFVSGTTTFVYLSDVRFGTT